MQKSASQMFGEAQRGRGWGGGDKARQNEGGEGRGIYLDLGFFEDSS